MKRNGKTPSGKREQSAQRAGMAVHADESASQNGRLGASATADTANGLHTTPFPHASAAAGHTVQFYASDDFLVKQLSQFIGEGLRAGDACIVVATPAHQAQLERRLASEGLELATAREQDRYAALDAHDTLAQFSAEGELNRERFAEVLGGAIARAAHGPRGQRRHVRIFGEMVALLWTEDQQNAAIRLEEFWNDLRTNTPDPSFSLMCAYPLHSVAGAANSQLFAAVCARHSQVLPDESYTALADPEDRLRTIAQLQQKAASLEAEIAERKQATEALWESEERLAAVFHSTAVGVAILTPDARFLQVNEAFCHIAGYSCDELVANLGCAALTHPDDLPLMNARLEALLAGDIPSFVIEKRYRRKDGEEIWVRNSVSLTRDAAGQPRHLVVLCEDISERKRAERASARLAAIVTSAEDTIASKTLDGIVTSWNASAERMFGYTAEEMIGQSILRIIPTDRHDEEDLILSRIRAGQRIEHFETVRQTKDGRPIEVSLTISPIRDSAGTITGASKIARDITERKRAGEDLKASEAALRANQAQLAAELADMTLLQHISSQLVHEGDLDTLYGQILEAAITVMRSDMGSMQMLYPERNELRLLAWKGFDPAAAAFWEWVRVDSGSTCGVALRTGERVLVPDVEACAFMDGTEDLDSYRLSGITAVQSTPLMSRSGHLVGMISTHWRTKHEPSERELHLLDLLARQAADLIERVRAQEALRESEAKFRTLADNIPTLAWMARPDGHIFWYNQRWYAYTGTTPASQEGWGWQSVHDPDTLPHVMRQWQQSLATGEPFEMVFPLRGADGVFRPFLTRIVPVKDERGEVVRWFGTNTDISDLRAAEEALRAANQRKDEFMGIASHELRTPLTSAKANVQIVARRLARALEASAADSGAALAKLQPLQQLLEHSEGALDRLNRLVSDLLDDSRIQAGKLELRPRRVDLTTLVRDATDEEAQGWLGREVRLEGLLTAQGENADATPGRDVWTEVDPDRVREVVCNYLSNAFKYAPPDQPISVRLEVVPTEHGSVARVAVRDQGPGLTPEQQAQLFERFYRVEGIAHQQGSNLGLGLGLYICRTIIERHGGRVGVESAPGAGSTFWFTLPLTGPSANAAPADASATDRDSAE